MQELYIGQQVMGDKSGDGTGDGMGDRNDKWMMRGEELGDKVREAGTWCAACCVWCTCNGVLSNRNTVIVFCRLWIMWL